MLHAVYANRAKPISSLTRKVDMERESKRSRSDMPSKVPVDTKQQPLKAVCTVANYTNSKLAFLPHLALSISSFLDNSHKWTLESASNAGYILLLDRLLASEWPGVTKRFRHTRCLLGIQCAATMGQVDVLNWWCTKYLTDKLPMEVKRDILRAAAFHGHLHVLIGGFFHSNKSLEIIEQMDPPLICQHPEIVHWIRSHTRAARLQILLDFAIAKGDVEFVAYVYGSEQDKNSSIATEKGIRKAAETGQLDMLKWLREHGISLASHMAMHSAAKGGQLNVLKWLNENNAGIEYVQPSNEAALNGHLHIVKWMIEVYEFPNQIARSRWFSKALNSAITRGNWPMIHYLFEHQPNRFLKRGFDNAVKLGDLELVKYLHSNGFESSRDPMVEAAEHGHLDILQWLFENIPARGKSDTVMDVAAQNNHLDIVIWLHENRSEGCSERVMALAASNGHLGMVQWLDANRPEYNRSNAKSVNGDADAMDLAADGGYLEVLQFLHNQRLENCTSFAMDQALANGHLHVARWLHEQLNLPWTPSGVYLATANGHCAVLDFLVSIQPDLKCDESAAMRAASQDWFHLIEWLEQHDLDLAARVVYITEQRMVDQLRQYTDTDMMIGRVSQCNEDCSDEESDDEEDACDDEIVFTFDAYHQGSDEE